MIANNTINANIGSNVNINGANIEDIGAIKVSISANNDDNGININGNICDITINGDDLFSINPIVNSFYFIMIS